MAEEVNLSGLLPFEVRQFLQDPGLIAVQQKKIEDDTKVLADDTAKLASDSATKTRAAAEDTVASAIQMATTTKVRVETALKAILTSSLVNPLGGD